MDVVRLHPDDVEAIARRTVELLRAEAHPPERLRTAREVAESLAVNVGWVYEHFDQLGGVRIGNGPKPRVRFDPVRSDLLRASLRRND